MLRPMACFIIALLVSSNSFSEGSKELNANGGNRAYLYSGASTSNPSAYPFPTWGTMKVYAKAGETIYVGSSAQGMGSGTINLRAPDGSTYTSGTSSTVGLIANHNQELAGPSPNTGGYTPYTRTVLAGQDGVWEIDFISPTDGVDIGNPTPVASSAAWVQYSDTYVAAFDVSVRDASNSKFLTGRVFTNVFEGILGTFDVGFNAIVTILTKDGYLYTLNNNGQAGNGFSFFANNKGFRNNNNAASYQSVDNLNSPNIQDARAADTQSDITHKIFFNAPAADLPSQANTPGGGTTWLLNTPITPTLTNIGFTGIEGTPNIAGTNPLGGNITFTASINGTYQVAIDVNGNGVYTDAIDRVITGQAYAGSNTVYWNGLDGQGNKVSVNTNGYNIQVSAVLNSGEVHFPFFDVERNVNGIILTRTNGSNAPDNTIYWDDTPITIVGTPPNPIKNLTGISSLVNGHKWGTPGAQEAEFGNNKGIDTWAYVLNTIAPVTLNVKLRESDLEVIGINAVSGCLGQAVTYTVAVRNNGPSDVTGAQFAFNFPSSLTNVVVSSSSTAGTNTLSAGTLSANTYNATLSMTSGGVYTFTITGVVSTVPTGGNLTVSASMLRPADYTDPDATNPDAAPPTDPATECNAAPSGTGCNNIKSNTIAYTSPPIAGPIQTVPINTAATMAGSGTGTWSQIGNTPARALITDNTNPATTITGLTTAGRYHFAFTNSNGCLDTTSVIAFTVNTIIPNIFTPNGDGKNDTFIIQNISSFPGSQLLIFNRWGNEVYRSDNYVNDWDGSKLTEGTYYYIFNRKESDGSHTTFKGWVFLKR